VNKTRRILAVAAIGLAVTLAGCTSEPTPSQKAETEQAERISGSMINNQPLPSFDRSQLRQNLIEIQTAQAKGVQSTTFFMQAGVPQPIFSCPSVGLPVPASTSLSNPWQIDRESNSYGMSNTAISQMEPTGVYIDDSMGTWVMCIDAQGRSYATYWEGEVHAVMAPAKWNAAAGQVELIGPPSFQFSGGK
jgi:hypothetical protein